MEIDEFIRICKKLNALYDKAYEIYKPQVKMIIKNKITDIKYIENILDQVMDIYTDKGFYLFLELCCYYSTINYQNACDYIEILKEQRSDEYEDIIKKYQKMSKNNCI